MSCRRWQHARFLKSMPFGARLKLRQNCLKRQVCRLHACMTAGSVSIPRSRRRHGSETGERAARNRGSSADSQPEPARAAPLRGLPARPDAERYAYTVRDLTITLLDIAVGISWLCKYGECPKNVDFAPRPHSTGGSGKTTGGQNRDPMTTGRPAQLPSVMRCRPGSRSVSAVSVSKVWARGSNA